MWKLKLPSKKDSLTNIDLALTYKNGKPKYPITTLERNAVKEIYKKYEKLKGEADSSLRGGTLSPALLIAFLDAYNEVQANGRLKRLRDRLFLNATLCPSCGITPPDELDHYLPISKFQCLAIYSSNLIPYCHTCNKRKMTVDGTDPLQRFIHVYYDDVPLEAQFLFAEIKIRGKGLTVKLEIKKIPELSPMLFQQMNFQIKRVNLNNRLLKELFNYLSSIGSYIQSDYEVGGKHAVKLNLLKNAENLRKQFGKNNWRPVVIDSLANYEKFCDGGFYDPLSLTK